MAKNTTIKTNLVGRKVRFARPEEVSRIAGEREITYGMDWPVIANEEGYPAGESGEIVSAFPDEDGKPTVQILVGGTLRDAYPTHGYIQISATSPTDRKIAALESIAVSLEMMADR